MVNVHLISESTLTERYQTTVPENVRRALQLKKREKIRYTIQTDGSVLLSKAKQDEIDPVLSHFLSFLANDIKQNPQKLTAITPELVTSIGNLIGHTEIDLNAPLSDEDE